MKNRIKMTMFLTTVTLILSACGNKGGGGSSSASAADPLIGSYFLSGTKTGTTDFVYVSAVVQPENKIVYIESISHQSNPSHFYFRKKEGVYVKHDNVLTITWNYETCEHYQTQNVSVTGSDPSDRIFLTIGPDIIQMLNANKWDVGIDFTYSSFVMTEDLNCNLM